MANYLILIIITVSKLNDILANHLGKCIQQTTCVCKFNQYATVNISTILGTQKWLEDSDGKTNTTFYFSGCKNYQDSKLGNTTFSVNIYIRYICIFIKLFIFSY